MSNHGRINKEADSGLHIFQSLMKQLETDIFSLNKKNNKKNNQIDLISAQTATLFEVSTIKAFSRDL